MDEEEPNQCLETKGTEISWKEGKDVTKKTVVKKQKNKKTKAVREVTTTTKNDSFFHFFNSMKNPDLEEADEEGDNEEIMQRLEEYDIENEIASQLTMEVIPNAAYYYMGIADDEGDEDEDNSDEESGSDEEGEKHTKAEKQKKEEGGKSEPAAKKECKQQ